MDNLGIEQSRRCLQGSAAHLCVAHESQRADSNGLLPLTRRVHEPVVLRWRGAGDRTRTCCSRGTGPARLLRRPTGNVSLDGTNPHVIRPSTWRLYHLGHKDSAPSRGFEPRLRRSERRVLPLDDEGKGPARSGRGGASTALASPKARSRNQDRPGHHQREYKAVHEGTSGVTRNGIRASAGVLSPLR